MFRQGVTLALVVVVLIWVYKSFIPPPPKICGTPGGPPITGPRILLRDGRHLSYEEYGVPKSMSKYKIVYIHGHSQNKRDSFLTTPGFFEEFQAYIVGFDRPGYGESDPHPERTLKSTSLDIEELADQLNLGTKFYVIGYSIGGALGWGCIKYIPHRLEGVILIAPAINYWWARLPIDLVEQDFYKQSPWKQTSIMIMHYVPWLTYWWNTQQLFPQPSEGNTDIMPPLNHTQMLQDYSSQQGVYESYLRDGMVLFGDWGFDPLDLENPLVGTNNKRWVHIWQGDIDEVVPPKLQAFVAKTLPWIHYHQVSNAGHLFALELDVEYQIMKVAFMQENGTLLSTNNYVPISV